jgi:hypothetical protein
MRFEVRTPAGSEEIEAENGGPANDGSLMFWNSTVAGSEPYCVFASGQWISFRVLEPPDVYTEATRAHR